MLGIFIAQLMRLNHAPNPHHTLGYFATSVPLASVCQIMGIIVTLVGCQRFLKYQKTMALGAAVAGGWEISLVAGLTLLVSHRLDALQGAFVLTHSCLKALVCIFVLVLVIAINKS